MEIVKEQYEILAKDMLRREKEGKPITFYHYMLDLTGGPCMYKRISGCGSGTEYMAVTPWGDLYPCHQFVGEEKYKLGDIWHGVTNDGAAGGVPCLQRLCPPGVRRLLGAGCIAPADAPPTPITPPAASAAFTSRAASCSASALNAPS